MENLISRAVKSAQNPLEAKKPRIMTDDITVEIFGEHENKKVHAELVDFDADRRNKTKHNRSNGFDTTQF